MPDIFIEARPIGLSEGAPITEYVATDYADHALASFNTQADAIEWARREGYRPRLARVRHLNDKSKPDHWHDV